MVTIVSIARVLRLVAMYVRLHGNPFHHDVTSADDTEAHASPR